MKTAFYAGSFDPFTMGHFNVVQRASKIFDKVIVGIGINSTKKRRFDAQKMKRAIEEVMVQNKLSNVTVICYEDLTVDAALANGADILVRGVRNGWDYAEEENIALTNEEISGLDTIFIRAGRMGYLSSSMVMELRKHGKDVSKYLPDEVLKLIS